MRVFLYFGSLNVCVFRLIFADLFKNHFNSFYLRWFFFADSVLPLLSFSFPFVCSFLHSHFSSLHSFNFGFSLSLSMCFSFTPFESSHVFWYNKRNWIASLEIFRCLPMKCVWNQKPKTKPVALGSIFWSFNPKYSENGLLLWNTLSLSFLLFFFFSRSRFFRGFVVCYFALLCERVIVRVRVCHRYVLH